MYSIAISVTIVTVENDSKTEQAILDSKNEHFLNCSISNPTPEEEFVNLFPKFMLLPQIFTKLFYGLNNYRLQPSILFAYIQSFLWI